MPQQGGGGPAGGGPRGHAAAGGGRAALRSHRAYVATLLALGLAGVVVLFAYSRTWVTALPERSGVPLPPRELTGAQLWAAGPATGVLLLAGVVAVVAARGHLRTAVGLLLALAALGAAVPALVTVADPTAAVAGALSAGAGATSVALTPWWLAAVGGGALGVLAAAAVVGFGRTWPAMSARYERVRGTGPASGRPADVWDALDRGEDPTRDGSTGDAAPGAAAPGRPG